MAVGMLNRPRPENLFLTSSHPGIGQEKSRTVFKLLTIVLAVFDPGCKIVLRELGAHADSLHPVNQTDWLLTVAAVMGD